MTQDGPTWLASWIFRPFFPPVLSVSTLAGKPVETIGQNLKAKKCDYKLQDYLESTDCLSCFLCNQQVYFVAINVFAYYGMWKYLWSFAFAANKFALCSWSSCASSVARESIRESIRVQAADGEPEPKTGQQDLQRLGGLGEFYRGLKVVICFGGWVLCFAGQPTGSHPPSGVCQLESTP